MSLTLAAAAAAAGVNKTGAIKAGKNNGNMDEHGQWRIEHRRTSSRLPPVTQRADIEAPHYHATAALEAAIAGLSQVWELLRGYSKRPAKTATLGGSSDRSAACATGAGQVSPLLVASPRRVIAPIGS